MKFLIFLLIALWVSAIALISVQNATPVTLRFLVFESVQIPIGLLLGFSTSLGILGAALILPASRNSAD